MKMIISKTVLLNACKKAEKAIRKSSALPILEDLLFTKGHVTGYDLEVSVRVPIDAEYRGKDMDIFTVNAKDIIAILSKLQEQPLVLEFDGEALTISTESAQFKLMAETGDNYPVIPTVGAQIGTITEKDIEHLGIANKFVSTDDLRPAMCGVYFDKKKMVATDAHLLYHKELEGKVSEQFIVPSKAAKIIAELGLLSVHKCKGKEDKELSSLCYGFTGDVEVTFRPEDSKYPDYAAVLPSDMTNYFTSDTSELMEKIDLAMLCANKTTHMVGFKVFRTSSQTAKYDIFSQDLNLQKYYRETIHSEAQASEDIEISMNGKFLSTIIKTIKGKSKEPVPVKVEFSTPTRAMLINKDFLLMPVLNS